MMTIVRADWNTLEDARPTAERYERLGYVCTIIEHRSERAGSIVKLVCDHRRDPVWDVIA